MGFGKMGLVFGGAGLDGGGKPHGGPFLLLVDGVSKLLLVNGTDRLLITGTNPAAATSGQPMGLLLALTYP